MSVIDKIVAAVTPPESEVARQEAREKALRATAPGDWLALVLEHHQKIEAAFTMVKEATTAPEQVAAQKKLATLLTGHSLAEEAVLYPALSASGENSHATKAYTEQSAAKLQLGLLEQLTPLTQDYLDKLEHLRGAVAHHVYEEESNWFLDIKRKLSMTEQDRLTARYQEEYDRYVGTDDSAGITAAPQPVFRPVDPTGRADH
jgi:hypothetical protein